VAKFAAVVEPSPMSWMPVADELANANDARTPERVVVAKEVVQNDLLVNAAENVMVQLGVLELFVIDPQLLLDPAVTVTPPVAHDAVGIVLLCWMFPWNDEVPTTVSA
jgi:hypothetical protein